MLLYKEGFVPTRACCGLFKDVESQKSKVMEFSLTLGMRGSKKTPFQKNTHTHTQNPMSLCSNLKSWPASITAPDSEIICLIVWIFSYINIMLFILTIVLDLV